MLSLNFRSINEPLAKGQFRKLDLGSNAELGSDNETGIRNGLWAYVECLRDLVGILFRENHLQHFEFARRQNVDRTRLRCQLIERERVVHIAAERQTTIKDVGDRPKKGIG